MRLRYTVTESKTTIIFQVYLIEGCGFIAIHSGSRYWMFAISWANECIIPQYIVLCKGPNTKKCGVFVNCAIRISRCIANNKKPPHCCRG